MGDNLQSIVDEMRVELRVQRGGFWGLRSDKLRAPLYIEVIPDGISFIVMAEYEGRMFFRQEGVDPEAFLNDLYVFVRRLLKEAAGPTAPSRLS